MPRTYKPQGKRYKKYDATIIKQALDEYFTTPGTSLGSIGQKYAIDKSVLFRHSRKFMKNPGGQPVLGSETEKEFVKYINVCAEWGYPVEPLDLRYLVKAFLDKRGVIEKRFKNNFPGPDFVESFMKRHKETLSQRLSQNIKRSRAAVSSEIINLYFNELQNSVKDIPLDNIINYDETNLVDDPGRRRIITKRGTKYPERVMNHSKASTSIMMACTASGILLPPYVVYKAQNLYDTWTINGPKEARFNRTSSGWFDSEVFSDWVKSIVIPFFEDKEGRKILIGDNLSCHLSIDLIKLCKEHDIDFVFLPANSTHLTQPLDVAFFRPMKTAWRNLLNQWKRTDGRQQSSVPKSCFPKLLVKLLETLKEKASENILAGFKKTGISPFDPSQVLKRLPDHVDHNSEANAEFVESAVLDYLKEMRYGTMNIVEVKRKKKINVIPGKSVNEESDHEYIDLENENLAKRVKNNTTKKTKTKEIKPKKGSEQKLGAKKEQSTQFKDVVDINLCPVPLNEQAGTSTECHYQTSNVIKTENKNKKTVQKRKSVIEESDQEYIDLENENVAKQVKNNMTKKTKTKEIKPKKSSKQKIGAKKEQSTQFKDVVDINLSPIPLNEQAETSTENHYHTSNVIKTENKNQEKKQVIQQRKSIFEESDQEYDLENENIAYNQVKKSTSKKTKTKEIKPKESIEEKKGANKEQSTRFKDVKNIKLIDLSPIPLNEQPGTSTKGHYQTFYVIKTPIKNKEKKETVQNNDIKIKQKYKPVGKGKGVGKKTTVKPKVDTEEVSQNDVVTGHEVESLEKKKTNNNDIEMDLNPHINDHELDVNMEYLDMDIDINTIPIIFADDMFCDNEVTIDDINEFVINQENENPSENLADANLKTKKIEILSDVQVTNKDLGKITIKDCKPLKKTQVLTDLSNKNKKVVKRPRYLKNDEEIMKALMNSD